MPLARQRDLTPRNHFNAFVCNGCGKELGDHWLFRPEKFADVRPDGNGRKPNGKLYCNRSQTAWAGEYHERALERNTISAGFAQSLGIIPKQGVPAGYQELRYGR